MNGSSPFKTYFLIPMAIRLCVLSANGFYGQKSTAHNHPDQEWRMLVPTQEDQLHLCCWWVLAIVSHGGRFGLLRTSVFLWSGHRSLRRKAPGCRSHSLSTLCTCLSLPGTYHRTFCIPQGYLQSVRQPPDSHGTCVPQNICNRYR